MTSSFVGTNPNQVPTNSDLSRLAYLDYLGWDDTGAAIPVIASASVITPVLKITKVSGTAAINTITPPLDLVNGGQLVLIPTARFSFDTTGNIALPLTAEVSKPIILTYESIAKKWYPSYSNTVNNLNVNASLLKNVSLNVGNSLTVTGDDTITLTNVEITSITGNFSCDPSVTNYKLVIGKQVIISANNVGTGYVATGTYYIIATNDTSTFQLSATFGGPAITTVVGIPTGLVFTCSPNVNFGRGGVVVYNDRTSKLSVFAETTSVELASSITDYTGTAGKLVFSVSPTLTGTVTVNGELVVNGNTAINASSLTVDDNNIELGSVSAVTGITGTISTVELSTVITSMSSVSGLIPGMVITRQVGSLGAGLFGGVTVITQILTSSSVSITSTTANTTGNITFDAAGASDATANNGGITVKGATNKTIIWDSTNSNWTSSEHWNISSAKTYKINNVQVLTSSAVLNDSSQTSVTVGGYATTVNIGTSATLATTLTIGATTKDNILIINGNNTSGTATLSTSAGVTTTNVFNTNALTGNLFGAATAVNIGAASGTLTIGNATITGTNATTLNLNGASPSITTTSTATASVFNTFATTGNLFGAATAVNIGAASGTLTIGNATITGTNATTLSLNGASPSITTTNNGTASVFNTIALTGNIFNAATTTTFGYTGTAASTTNISTGATLTATTKTINIGTNGATGSTTTISIGSTAGGTTTVNNALNVVVGGNTYPVGYANVPQVIQNADFSAFTLNDMGKHYYHASATAHTYTVPAGVFAIGATLMFVNRGAGVLTIRCDPTPTGSPLPATESLLQSITGSTGSRALAAFGVATMVKITATDWIISGTGLS